MKNVKKRLENLERKAKRAEDDYGYLSDDPVTQEMQAIYNEIYDELKLHKLQELKLSEEEIDSDELYEIIWKDSDAAEKLIRADNFTLWAHYYGKRGETLPAHVVNDLDKWRESRKEEKKRQLES